MASQLVAVTFADQCLAAEALWIVETYFGVDVTWQEDETRQKIKQTLFIIPNRFRIPRFLSGR